MTVNEARRHLQDNTPARAQTDSVQLNKKTSLVRVWTDMPLDTLPDLESFLRTYTDPKNTSASSTVTDPYADREKHAGTWRLGRVWSETVREETRLYQELHLGFIQSIVLDAADASTWSEAQVVDEVKTDATDEGLLRLRWINVDPAKVHTIIDVLSEVKSYTTVYADGESKGGTWYLHEVVGGKDAGNGGGEIVMKLGLAEETRTFTLGDGTLRPQTVVRYFGVPKSRVETIKAGIAAASTRQNIDIRIDEAYANGECVLTVTTTTMTLVEWNTTIGEAWDITRTQYWKWHVIQSEIESFETTLSIGTLEQGKQKSIVKTSNGDGTWDIIATIQSVTHGTDEDYNEFESDLTVYIDALTTQRQLKWFHLTDAQKAFLINDLSYDAAQAEGVTLRYEDYRVPQFGTWHLTVYITTEDSETSSVIVTDIGGDPGDEVNGTLRRKDFPGAEAEVRHYGWFSIPDSIVATALTALETAPSGWLVESIVQNRRPEKKLSDLIWTIHKVGTVDNVTENMEFGSNAEQRVVRLVKRDPGSAPSTPTMSGYTCVKREILRIAETIADYIFYFTKVGVSSYEFQTDYDALDAEVRYVIYPNRSSNPTPSTPAGFYLVRREIGNPDGVLQDYTYVYAKTGETAHLTDALALATSSGRRIQVTYRDQTVDPSDTDGMGADAAHFVDYEASNYTLVRKRVTASGRGVEDWTFVYVYNGDYDTAFTVAYTTPGFMERRVEIFRGVPDDELATQLSTYKTSGESDEVVAEVRSDYNEGGTSTITRIVLTLPSSGVTETKYIVERRESGIRPSSYSAISTNKELFVTDFDNDVYGKVDSWSEVTVPILRPAAYHVTGKSIRVWYVVKTTSYHKTAPSVSAPAEADDYESYTEEGWTRDLQYGFYVKESVAVTLTQDWVTAIPAP